MSIESTKAAAESPSTSDQAVSTVANKPKYGIARRVLRGVVWGTLSSFVLTLVIVAGIFTWLDSDHGRARLVEVINRSGIVSLKSLQGSLWSRLEVRDLVVNTADVEVKLDHGVLDWSPYALLLRDVYLDEVLLNTLQIHLKPQPPMKTPTPPPTSLTLPFGLKIIKLNIAKLDISDVPLLQDIQASLDSNGKMHRLSVLQIRAPQGKLSAALNLKGLAPFETAGSFVLAGELEGRQLTAVGHVLGDLRALAVKADLDADQVSANIEMQLDVFAPHAYQMLQHGSAKLNQINPAAFHPSAPQALINADVKIQPTATGAQMQLSLQNQRPNTLDRQGLPLRSLNAELSLDGNELQIKSLLAQLSGNGQIRASGKIKDEKLNLQLDLQAIDPALLWSPQPASQMAGRLSITGPWLAPDVKGKISDRRFNAVAEVDLGWIRPDVQRRIAVRQLALSRGVSQVTAKGEVNLMSPFDFKLDAELKQFNPAEYASVPSGSISADINTSGALKPIPQIDLAYILKNSRFNGEALAGQGRLKLSQDRLQDSLLWLSLGANRVDLKGALGRVNDQLTYQLHLPNLAVIGREFSGLVEGQGVLSGPFTLLQIQGGLKASKVKTPWDLSVQQADIQLDLRADLQGPMKLQADLTQLVMGETQLNKINLWSAGSRNQHEITLSVKGLQAGQELELNTTLAGALSEQFIWQGKVKTLAGKSIVPFQLLAPMTLLASSEQVKLGVADLQLGQSVIRLGHFDWRPGLISTQGEFKKIVVADWLPLLGNKEIRSDLVLAGGWSIEQAQDINGSLNLKRLAGDVVWQGAGATAQAVQLSDLQLNAKINKNQLSVLSNFQSPRFGLADFSLTAALDPRTGQPLDYQPVVMNLRGDLPDLALLSPFMGPDMRLAGRAKMNVQRVSQSGVVKMTGLVQGSALSIRDANTGIRLTDGELDVVLSNQQIQLRTLKFNGGKGSITGSGVIEMGQEGLVGSAKLVANQFTLISKPDMLLVMSGQGAIEFRDGTLQVNGQFVADEGDIQFVSNDVPRLSADVVVLGRERVETSRALPINIELNVDLGNNFRFRGYGLDAQLIGQLRLRAQANQALRANGTVSVDRGEYRAYGRTLDIERGVLSFIGPVDNPGLDVLAMRRNQSVEVGVRVQGTAQSPRISLVSEPNVPDAEKISWLLFGHGVDSIGSSDSALALQLLNSMATGNSGPSITGRILGTVGLDDASYSSVKESDGSTTQVVSVTKHLGRNFSVSLDKSFTGLRDAIRFTLQLSRNWSVVSRFGIDSSSVDVNWTRQF
ncbi:translocation/assembly module TamB domain-containing protein [Deefgea rivuli]|uniref:translocation/assembly module TamB domain-containing protein n=1 Tax=Deefgea rivuli TaxID=400948 RepID=UPI0004888684|nr:translocation/assembly module TamB domain-containing protein [Deefgea rivuli]